MSGVIVLRALTQKRESYGIGRGSPSLTRPLYMVGRGNAKGMIVEGRGTREPELLPSLRDLFQFFGAYQDFRPGLSSIAPTGLGPCCPTRWVCRGRSRRVR